MASSYPLPPLSLSSPSFLSLSKLQPVLLPFPHAAHTRTPQNTLKSKHTRKRKTNTGKITQQDRPGAARSLSSHVHPLRCRARGQTKFPPQSTNHNRLISPRVFAFRFDCIVFCVTKHVIARAFCPWLFPSACSECESWRALVSGTAWPSTPLHLSALFRSDYFSISLSAASIVANNPVFPCIRFSLQCSATPRFRVWMLF